MAYLIGILFIFVSYVIIRASAEKPKTAKELNKYEQDRKILEEQIRILQRRKRVKKDWHTRIDD